MTTASEIPEGAMARCPTCARLIPIDPSRTTGDVFCPGCRVSLWFVVVEKKARLYPQDRLSLKKKQFIAALVASPDSLDVVELVMELEDEMGSPSDTTKISEIRSLGELIDYILREMPD